MWWRRRREWIDGWEVVVPEVFPHWHTLDDHDRARLGELIEWLVRRKRFEAARGFALSQEIVLTIASHAALLLLGLPRRTYRDVAAIIVHPHTITSRGVWSTSIRGVVTAGPRRVLGHALDRRGPVVLSWSAIHRAAPGHNVVIHEFAHKLDAVAGMFDGTPEIDGRSERAEWVRVCTREYRRLRRHPGEDLVLRDYAATNPAEFFAVATEAFFERPLALAEAKPELYGVLRGFYRQDPATRVVRAR